MARSNKSSLVFTLLAALMAVFLVAAPALATHGKNNAKHKASSDRDGDAYTEDKDTNDGGTANNVEDDGDNKHPSGKDRSVENGNSGNQGNSTSDPDDDGRGPDRSNGGPDKPNGSGGEDLADQDGNNGCGNDDDFEDDNEGWCGKPPKADEDEVEGDNVCEANEHMPAGHEKDCDEVEGDGVCEDDEVMADGEACEGSENEKVTICHATGSATNPWVTITVDANGLNGHDDHEGDIMNPVGECGIEVAGSETVPCEDEMTEADGEVCDAVLGTDEAVPGDMVLGAHLSKPGDATGEEGPSVLGASAEAGEEGGVLPFTGGAILPFLFVAGALIAAGVLLFRRDRTQGI